MKLEKRQRETTYTDNQKKMINQARIIDQELDGGATHPVISESSLNYGIFGLDDPK